MDRTVRESSRTAMMLTVYRKYLSNSTLSSEVSITRDNKPTVELAIYTAAHRPYHLFLPVNTSYTFLPQSPSGLALT